MTYEKDAVRWFDERRFEEGGRSRDPPLLTGAKQGTLSIDLENSHARSFIPGGINGDRGGSSGEERKRWKKDGRVARASVSRARTPIARGSGKETREKRGKKERGADRSREARRREIHRWQLAAGSPFFCGENFLSVRYPSELRKFSQYRLPTIRYC